MAKSKYETHILPHLDDIEAWARAGATAKEIAKKLGLAYSTFRKYLDAGRAGEERYAAMVAPFTHGCEVADDKVEAALFKRATGYQYDEITTEEKLDRDGVVHTLTKTVKKDIPPDITSIMFWLANRMPERWKYKPDGTAQDDGKGGTGVVELAQVMPPTPPPDENGGGDSG